MDLFGIGGALLGGLLGGKDSQQTQSATKTPYGPATGWLDANIADGQALQNYYKQNPFSAGQTQALNNSNQFSNQFRNTSNSLMGQMSNPQYFDRNNQNARPQAYDFTGGAAQFAPQPTTQAAQTTPQAMVNPWDAINRQRLATPQQKPVAGLLSSGGGGQGESIGAGPSGGGFNYDPNSYTGGLLGALLGSGTMAPVEDMSTLSAEAKAALEAAAGYGNGGNYGGYTTGSGYSAGNDYSGGNGLSGGGGNDAYGV